MYGRCRKELLRAWHEAARLAFVPPKTTSAALLLLLPQGSRKLTALFPALTQSLPASAQS